jgi:hypothetical protein
MRQFQKQAISLADVQMTPLLCGAGEQSSDLETAEDPTSEDERTDPNLTLNLLRQKNDNEIRCGSAKLNERRTFYFSGAAFTDMARNSPTP